MLQKKKWQILMLFVFVMCQFIFFLYNTASYEQRQGSLVSTVTDYGLNDYGLMPATGESISRSLPA